MSSAHQERIKRSVLESYLQNWSNARAQVIGPCQDPELHKLFIEQETACKSRIDEALDVLFHPWEKQ
jgi:hypothetical protein